MTHIERRQARLAKIRAQIQDHSQEADCLPCENGGPSSIESGIDSRYVMASSQNQPVDLGYAAVNCLGSIHRDPYLIVSLQILQDSSLLNCMVHLRTSYQN